jgi:hypothetical protein
LNGISGNPVILTSPAISVSWQPAVKRGQRGNFVKKIQISCTKRLLELAGFISRL